MASPPVDCTTEETINPIDMTESFEIPDSILNDVMTDIRKRKTRRSLVDYAEFNEEEEEVPKKTVKKREMLTECEIPLDQVKQLFVRIMDRMYNGTKYSSFSIIRKNLEGDVAYTFEMKRAYIVPLLTALKTLLLTSSWGEEISVDNNGSQMIFQSRLYQPMSIPIANDICVQIQPEPSIIGAMSLVFIRMRGNKTPHPFKVSMMYLAPIYNALMQICKTNENRL